MTANPCGIFPYVWTWGTCAGCPNRSELNRHFCPPECEGKYPELGKRRGMRCRILSTGAKGSVRLEFEDGFKTVTSLNGLRKAR